MRRSVARGRVFPQSYSTDRRYGKLSLKAVGLFPLIWTNCDDQGRIFGDPDEIKYSCCPNVDHISKADIPSLLVELVENKLILLYDTDKGQVIQMLDWWDIHRKMQWAWPSEYPPPDGWKDHMRYKKDAKTVAKLNWPVSGEDSGEDSAVFSGEDTGEDSADPPEGTPPLSPQTPYSPPITNNTENGRGRGKRNSPEGSGEKTTSPAPIVLSTGEKRIFDKLTKSFRIEWGRVLPNDIYNVVERDPNYREIAMMRDLAVEIYAAGGCPDDMIKEAFKEVAGQESTKMNISYVRAVLLDWLGIQRAIAERKHAAAQRSRRSTRR